MFEKVNPAHPDKVADRIAGALVDLAYKIEETPKIAVEVLIGHGECNIIVESSCVIPIADVESAVHRIAGDVKINYRRVPQDEHLAHNQDNRLKCGDNGIFKGVPITEEQMKLSNIARTLYDKYNSDGKYILSDDKLIICQSNAKTEDIKMLIPEYPDAEINPLGEWTGGTNVDTGATNRKLGSDMGDSITGGGLHGKDLSKADVALNICAWLYAQKFQTEVKLCCAIGQEIIDGEPYQNYVKLAKKFIDSIGGFEKFAEWGFI